jgi:predicted dehydrogenase
MNIETSLTRRDFLAIGAAAVAAPAILRGADLATEPVRIGHIGTGTRGWGLIKYTGAIPEAKVVAVCDVYGPHLARGLAAAGNPGAKSYHDYRDLLADRKVEAVVIATPDHWHEKMVIDAVAAGKAVYCEKGLTTSIAAAKRMRAAVKKAGTVFQLGHQGRQLPATAEAGRLIREGRIGPVTLIHIGRFFNGTKERAPWRWFGDYSEYNRPDPAGVIKQLDWGKWLGPAPKIDFNERHFWHWRCYYAYGTGYAGDLLSHETDFVQYLLGHGIPDSCISAGQIALLRDDREVPDTWSAIYHYEKLGRTVTFTGSMTTTASQPVEICGRDATLRFDDIAHNVTKFDVIPAGYKEQAVRLPSYQRGKTPPQPNHMEDWVNCIRSRGTPKCSTDERPRSSCRWRPSSEGAG